MTRHWRRRKLLPKSSLDHRQAAIRGQGSRRMQAVYQYCKGYNNALSEEERLKNPYEVDHCIPLDPSYGGLHVYTNVWIVRRSMNTRGPQRRTQEEIVYALTQANLDPFKAHETWPNS